MPRIWYPDNLPGPWVGIITAFERRASTDQHGPVWIRSKYREQLYTQQVEFVFKPGQAAIFRDWFNDDLHDGGHWFVANWTHVKGRTSLTERRFFDTPDWEHMPGGNWRVKGVVEVREGFDLETEQDFIPVFYKISGHDWGIIETDYIYISPNQAAGAAQLAYETVWNKPHGQPPPDGRGTYIAIPNEGYPDAIDGNTVGNPSFPPPYWYRVYRLKGEPYESLDVGTVLGRWINPS